MNKRFSGNIKGSTTLAMEVLEIWGLQFVKTHAVLNADDNTARSVTVYFDGDIETVIEWYGRASPQPIHGKGYEPGTLLHWRSIEEG